MRGGLFVNRATILVLHLCSLEHSLAFVLLACVFVIAWLAVDLRLVVVGVEVARIRPVAHIHDEVAGEEQGMAYFGTASDKKAMVTISERKRKITLIVYQECLGESKQIRASKNWRSSIGNSTEFQARAEHGLASKFRKRSRAGYLTLALRNLKR